MKHFRIVMLILLSLTLGFGCASYDEGDDAAAIAFQKMTAEEGTLYKGVQDVWGQSRLRSIRDSVSQREIKPVDSEIPFIDISKLIRTNNTVTLKLDQNWGTDTKNQYILSRWDRIDEQWYREIMKSIGINKVVKQALVVEEKTIEEQEVAVKQKIVVEHVEDIENIDIDTIISISQYDNIYYEIRNCDAAIERYKEIIEKGILLKSDYQSLIIISTKCKADEILTKLEQ